MMGILAQTDGNAVTWMQVATLVLMPILLAGVVFILSRLKRGDDKFDTLAISNAQVSTEVRGLNEGNKDLASAIEKLVDKLEERTLEGAGTLGEFKQYVAREYVLKEECKDCTEQLRAEIGEAKALADIHRIVRQIQEKQS